MLDDYLRDGALKVNAYYLLQDEINIYNNITKINHIVA